MATCIEVAQIPVLAQRHHSIDNQLVNAKVKLLIWLGLSY